MPFRETSRSARVRTLSVAGALAVAAGGILLVGAAPASADPAGTLVDCHTSPSFFSTGYDSATGAAVPVNTVDPDWQVSDAYDANWTGTAPADPAVPPANVVWHPAYAVASRSVTSSWISAEQFNAPVTAGEWFYKYTFRTAPNLDPATLHLTLALNADDHVSDVLVNGVSQTGIAAGLPAPSDGIFATATVQLDSGWRSGENTIAIKTDSFTGNESMAADGVSFGASCSATYSVANHASVTRAAAGDVVSYTLTAASTGGDAGPAALTEDLSNLLADAKYNGDVAGGATVSGDSLSWATSNLPVGASRTITFSTTVKAGATVGDRMGATTVPGRGGSCVTSTGCTVTTKVIRAGSELAVTGTDAAGGIAVGSLAVIVGLGLVLMARRRAVHPLS
jgi:hypothetical protein